MNFDEKRNQLRQEAMDFQMSFAYNSFSYAELIACQSYFEEQAEKYGLTEEFKENGII